MIINDEWERMWKEAVVTQSEAQTVPDLGSRYVPEGPAQVGTEYTYGQLSTIMDVKWNPP